MQKLHILTDDKMDIKKQGTGTVIDEQEDQFLLISVGAKRVLTAWKRKIISKPKSEMSFQWLSSGFPIRNSVNSLKGSKEKNTGNLDNNSLVSSDSCDGLENDWRYLAVTSFLVKLSGSR